MTTSLFLAAAVHASKPPTCTLQHGIQFIGNDVSAPSFAADLEDCCTSCSKDRACAFFTFEATHTDGGVCHHQGNNAPDRSRHNATCTSGYVGSDPPAPPAKPTYDLNVGRRISTTGEAYVCWNIDASANRGFFWRNLSTAAPFGAQLARQAAAIGSGQAAGHSIVRFGGSGNDFLTYAFGGQACPTPSEYKQCLNETTWRDLLSFIRSSNAKMIVGLSMNTGEDWHHQPQHSVERDAQVDATDRRPWPFPYPWDPANARKLLQWTISHGFADLIVGLELGNEQNTKYTAEEMANNTAILFALATELWPDPRTRPGLYGPDPHGLHDSSSTPSRAELDWISAWLRACAQRRIPIEGVTRASFLSTFLPTPCLLLLHCLVIHVACRPKAAQSNIRLSARSRVHRGDIEPPRLHCPHAPRYELSHRRRSQHNHPQGRPEGCHLGRRDWPSQRR